MPVQTGRSATANGNILPFCAVMIDTTIDNRLIPATAGARAIGIAGKGRRYAPWAPLDDGFLAIAGEVFNYYANGEEQVPAKLGAACNPGDRLKVMAGALLTPTTADTDFFIAIARMAGIAGEIIDVDVVIGQAAA